MEIKCPTCATFITADNINIQTGLAVCSQCNKAFSAVTTNQQKPSKKQLGAIKGIRVYRHRSDTIIELSWFSSKAFGFLFFTILWNAIIFGSGLGTTSGIFMTVFGLFPLIGIAIAYLTICHFINKTKFIISREFLIVKHGPLPCGRKVTILKHDISQIFVAEKITQTPRSRNGYRSTIITYALEVELKSGDKRSLMSDHFYEKVLKVEQEIETALGITDTPVHGEIQ